MAGAAVHEGVNIHSAGSAGHQAIASADAAGGTSIAVAKKALDNTKLEGKLAVGLIEGAGQPPPPTATRGTRVNTYA